MGYMVYFVVIKLYLTQNPNSLLLGGERCMRERCRWRSADSCDTRLGVLSDQTGCHCWLKSHNRRHNKLKVCCTLIHQARGPNGPNRVSLLDKVTSQDVKQVESLL